jgi:hypothetical protein
MAENVSLSFALTKSTYNKNLVLTPANRVLVSNDVNLHHVFICQLGLKLSNQPSSSHEQINQRVIPVMDVT